MKTKLLLFASALLMALNLQAQAPEKFNYQGIARDNAGDPLANQALGLRISILDGSTAEYVETHSVTTNGFGLYTLQIGDGTPVSGTMAGVDWASGNKFIKVEIDPNGGTNYTSLGTTELLSVPYALYAAEAPSAGGPPTGAAGGDLTGNYPNPAIAGSAVTSGKIDNGAVATTDLANNAVTSGKIDNGAVATADLANNSVTSGKIDNGTIATADIGNNAVNGTKIAGMGATTGQVLEYDGTNWAPATVSTGAAGWELDGNAAGPNDFIGTTNSEPLRFKVGNQIAGEVSGGTNTSFGYETLKDNTTGSLNTALGYNAMSANTTGLQNTAIGYSALDFNTTGEHNTATGVYALRNNTTGDDNTANGGYALGDNTTGEFNTAGGFFALRLNTTGNNNTAFGYRSLQENTTESGLSAFGYEALKSNTTGSNNVAVGYQALKANTTGDYNTATGYLALGSNTTGKHNTALGAFALQFNTIGEENTGIGRSALRSNTTGNLNTAVGRNALSSNTTGSSNTASGWGALSSNTTGESNTAVGDRALYYNTTGNLNTVGGWAAMFSNTTGYGNVAWGRTSLYSNTTGGYNVAIGMNALNDNTTADENTAIGHDALRSNTVGEFNTAIGAKADVAIDNLTNATAIGAKALVGASNSLVLGSINGVNGATASVNVGIGTTTPLAGLEIKKNSTLGLPQIRLREDGDDYARITFQNSNSGGWQTAAYAATAPETSRFNIFYDDGTTGGNILSVFGHHKVGINAIPGTGISDGTLTISNGGNFNDQLSLVQGSNNYSFYADSNDLALYYNGSLLGEFDSGSGLYTTSDRRLKENIRPAGSLLEKVEKVKVMRYTFKRDKEGKPSIGYIAQSLDKQFPEFVNKPNPNSEREKYYTVNYAGMSAVAIKAIQEQQKMIEDLQKTVKQLQAELEELKK